MPDARHDMLPVPVVVDYERCPAHQAHGVRIENVEKRVDAHESAILAIRNRLPLWASMMFALLLGAVGWLI